MRDGRVARVDIAPLPTSVEKDARRRAAWEAIRAALDDYRADGTSNESRLDRTIDRIASALGATFESLNPVGLGVQAGYLLAYAERADAIFLPGRAADLVGLNIAVASFLPQFAEWKAYLADAEARPEVTPEALAAAIAVADLIAQSDAVEPEVKAPVAEMKADALDEASGRDSEVPRLATDRQRLLGAIGNVFATAGKIALDLTKAGLNWTGKVAKAGLDRTGKGVGNAIEKGTEAATLTLFGAAGEYLLILAGQSPSLAWLSSLIAFLKSNAPKD